MAQTMTIRLMLARKRQIGQPQQPSQADLALKAPASPTCWRGEKPVHWAHVAGRWGRGQLAW